MSTSPVAAPAGVPKVGNASPVLGHHMMAADATLTYLAVCRRQAISWIGIPLTANTASSGDKLPLKIRIPPWNLKVQWSICATGSGICYVHASAAPASETYNTAIEIDKPYVDLQENEPWAWTALDWATPDDNGDPRPLLCSPTTDGLPDTQIVDIWLVNTGGGKGGIRVYAMEFRPLPRVAADGELV